MSVRTYNPSVRVGNWNEDLCLEEVRERKPTRIICMTHVYHVYSMYTCNYIILYNTSTGTLTTGAIEGFPGEEGQGRTDGPEEN